MEVCVKTIRRILAVFNADCSCEYIYGDTKIQKSNRGLTSLSINLSVYLKDNFDELIEPMVCINMRNFWVY